MSDETARSTWRREYDLVDGSTPEPVDLAPTSEDTPAVDPFARHRADEATGHTMSDTLDKKAAELRQYLDDATRAVKAERDAARADAERLGRRLAVRYEQVCTARADAGRLAAALRQAEPLLLSASEQGIRGDFDGVWDLARAALARHEDTP